MINWKFLAQPRNDYGGRTILLSLIWVVAGGCYEPRTPEEIHAGFVADVHFYREQINVCQKSCPAASVNLDLGANIPVDLEELMKFRNRHIKESRTCFKNCYAQKGAEGVDPMNPLLLGGAFIVADELMD